MPTPNASVRPSRVPPVLSAVVAMFAAFAVFGAPLGLLASCAGPAAGGQEPAAVAAVAAAAEGRFDVWVLGTAQDGGLPHLGCDRPCCTEARAAGRRIDPACLGVRDRESGRLVLVEATPGIEAQVALLHRLAGAPPRGRTPVDAVLVTHAHLGHWLGLLWFGREVLGGPPIPVHVSEAMAAFLRGNPPFRLLLDSGHAELRPFATGAPFEPLAGLTVTALRVPHRDELSDTHAFVLRGPTRAVLFVPDVDAWDREPGLLQRLVDGVDVAYVDGTFFDGSEVPGRSLAEIPHPLMCDTMARLSARARQRPGSIRFLHLNHSNRALTDPELQAAIERAGFAVARVGERVAL